MTRQSAEVQAGVWWRMEDAFDPGGVQWIARSPVPVDFKGPSDLPYDAEAAALLEQRGVEAIELAAARWPDRIVLDDGVRRLTYAEVMDRVYGLAGRILDATPAGSVVA